MHPRIERALEYYCGIHHVWANPLGKCQLDISLSLSLSHSRSLPPSLSFSLPLSLSIPGMLSGTSYDTVVQARHDRFLLMPSRPVGRTRTRRVSGSPSQVLSHKHSTSPCKYMLDIKVRSECKREEDTGRSKREIARDSFDARPVALLRAYLTEPRSNLCSASRPEHGAVLGG